MPDRLLSLVVLVGFWIPPAVAGWVAGGFVQRNTKRDRAKVTYAVLATFVLGYAAAWFLFNLGRMPPYIPGASTDPTIAPPRAVAGLGLSRARWCCPAARWPARWRFAAVPGCSDARLRRVSQPNPPMSCRSASRSATHRLNVKRL